MKQLRCGEDNTDNALFLVQISLELMCIDKACVLVWGIAPQGWHLVFTSPTDTVDSL